MVEVASSINGQEKEDKKRTKQQAKASKYWETVLSHLRCPRCDALMRREKIIFGGEICTSWICTSCGEVVDQVILENRTLQSKERGKPIRSTPYIHSPKM